MLNDSLSPAGIVLSLLLTVAVEASAAVSAVVVVVVVAVIVSVVAWAVTPGTLGIVAEKQLDEKPLNYSKL